MGKIRGAGVVSDGEQLSTKDLRPLFKCLIDEGDRLRAFTIKVLRSTDFGRAFLQYAKKIRPSQPIDGDDFDLDELLFTYDGEALLDQLLLNPECGTNPSFYIWQRYWTSPTGDDQLYGIMVEIAQVRERRRGIGREARERLRIVRKCIEREWELERYAEWRDTIDPP